MRNIIIIAITAIMTVAIAGCSNNTIYSEYQPIPLSGWHKDSTLVWQVQVTDTIHAFNVVASVRHTNAYPYQNIWLFTENDTLEYYLADQRGRWLGSGFGDKKEMPCLLQKGIRFPHSGTYEFLLKQGMREEQLKGISEVGLIIERQ